VSPASVVKDLMLLPDSTVGRKLVMAVTGQFMIFYIVAHVLGNYTLFAGAINAYAEGLRHWPYLIILWSSRALLLLSFVLHTWYGIVLKLENRKAKPEAYAVTQYRTASFAGRTMIWSGLLIGLFVLFHLLHFTFQVIEPGIGAIKNPDALGRPDVFTMVVSSFRGAGIAALYLIGVSALALHLYHGIESSIQSEGLNNERTLPVVVRTGMAMSIVLLFMYAAIPVIIVSGFFKP
jgi:succinate dehydrogenase / fumarate reductase cytochrome b subunit